MFSGRDISGLINNIEFFFNTPCNFLGLEVFSNGDGYSHLD